MRWNNYDMNVYVSNGTVWIAANQLVWSGELDSHGMPIYRNNSWDSPESHLALFMNRPEHERAISYVLDKEFWDDPKHLFTDRTILESDSDPFALVTSFWDEYDDWQDGATWNNPPEPIRSWVYSLPSYHVALDPDVERMLIDGGYLDADGSTEVWLNRVNA